MEILDLTWPPVATTATWVWMPANPNGWLCFTKRSGTHNPVSIHGSAGKIVSCFRWAIRVPVLSSSPKNAQQHPFLLRRLKQSEYTWPKNCDICTSTDILQLQQIYLARCKIRTCSIIKDCSHPGNALPSTLPSPHTSQHRNSIFRYLQPIMILNRRL